MRILKSLSAIMAINILGWMNNSALPFYMPMLRLSPMDALYPPQILVSITILATSCNAPILFFFRLWCFKCFCFFRTSQFQHRISKMLLRGIPMAAEKSSTDSKQSCPCNLFLFSQCTGSSSDSSTAFKCKYQYNWGTITTFVI